ncbi:hypothetical protein ScPMuIL_003983 [Solemya velum]
MTQIMKRLQYLEFPECSIQALEYLVLTHSSQPGTVIPGFGGHEEEISIEISQNYILFQNRKGKLSAVQELNLLEMLCHSLQTAPEGSRYTIFKVIFGGKPEECKTLLLTSLVSMALSTSCGAVLDCAALWMQEHDCYSKPVCDLSRTLVEDYCILFSDVNPAFQRLPSVSPLFTCNLITAVTTIYPFRDKKTIPPASLLEYLTEWISDDYCLCSESVRLVRIQAHFSCPFPGLVNWCVLGPLVLQCENSNEISVSENTSIVTLSKLHLSVLQSLQAYRSMELSQELFLMSTMLVVAQTLLGHQKQKHPTDKDLIHSAIDRLGQVIQVALETGSLKVERGRSELRKINKLLPHNRLLSMVSRKYAAEPMDVS